MPKFKVTGSARIMGMDIHDDELARFAMEDPGEGAFLLSDSIRIEWSFRKKDYLFETLSLGEAILKMRELIPKSKIKKATSCETHSDNTKTGVTDLFAICRNKGLKCSLHLRGEKIRLEIRGSETLSFQPGWEFFSAEAGTPEQVIQLGLDYLLSGQKESAYDQRQYQVA